MCCIEKLDKRFSVRILSKRERNVRTVNRGQEAGVQFMRAGIPSRHDVVM